MKVSFDSPLTERERLIFSTMSANPNVCTVPDKVNITENYPLLKNMYTQNTTTASMIQYMMSAFFMIPIFIL